MHNKCKPNIFVQGIVIFLRRLSYLLISDVNATKSMIWCLEQCLILKKLREKLPHDVFNSAHYNVFEFYSHLRIYIHIFAVKYL